MSSYWAHISRHGVKREGKRGSKLQQDTIEKRKEAHRLSQWRYDERKRQRNIALSSDIPSTVTATTETPEQVPIIPRGKGERWPIRLKEAFVNQRPLNLSPLRTVTVEPELLYEKSGVGTFSPEKQIEVPESVMEGSIATCDTFGSPINAEWE